MQAFGLLVVDLDGEKVSALASQLTEQGYSVATTSVSATDPAPPATSPAGATAGTVTDAGAAVAPPPAETADTATAVTPQATVTGEPDNTQPFKCPACGQTFDVEVVCTNQHDPVQTVPTADVLAGAEPAAPEAAAPVESPASNPGETAVESPAEPSGQAAPADPAADAGAAAADPSQPAGEPGWPA